MILHFTLAGTRYDTAAEAVREWERLCQLDSWWKSVKVGVVFPDRVVFIDPRLLRVEREREVG